MDDQRPPAPTATPAANAISAACGRPAAGEVTRDRLLEIGLQLFAEQGFAKTSIRQIAQAAGTNVAAVSYYFGNKAGLYRAVYWSGDDPSVLAAGLPLTSLGELFDCVLEPRRRGGRARLWVKLQRREMLEPSGLWQERVDRGMRPLHDALVALLCDRLGIAVADDDIQALAVLVIAPAVHLLLHCEVIDLLAPRLLEGDAAVDGWCRRLLRNAELLIADEAQARRAAVLPGDAPEAPAAGPRCDALPVAAAPHRPPRSPA